MAAIDRLREGVESGQIRRLTGGDYAKDLVTGDAVAVIGWAADAIQLQADNPQLEWRMPTEGCMVWWDHWVVPVGAPNPTAGVRVHQLHLRAREPGPDPRVDELGDAGRRRPGDVREDEPGGGEERADLPDRRVHRRTARPRSARRAGRRPSSASRRRSSRRPEVRPRQARRASGLTRIEKWPKSAPGDGLAEQALHRATAPPPPRPPPRRRPPARRGSAAAPTAAGSAPCRRSGSSPSSSSASRRAERAKARRIGALLVDQVRPVVDLVLGEEDPGAPRRRGRCARGRGRACGSRAAPGRRGRRCPRRRAAGSGAGGSIRQPSSAIRSARPRPQRLVGPEQEPVRRGRRRAGVPSSSSMPSASSR